MLANLDFVLKNMRSCKAERLVGERLALALQFAAWTRASATRTIDAAEQKCDYARLQICSH